MLDISAVVRSPGPPDYVPWLATSQIATPRLATLCYIIIHIGVRRGVF
jgi:hypothetical protein